MEQCLSSFPVVSKKMQLRIEERLLARYAAVRSAICFVNGEYCKRLGSIDGKVALI